MKVSLVQIGDGAETDMRMWPDVDALPRQEFGGTSMVEEYERADHLSVRCGQRPSDFETAKIASARND
jgi:hypothetical protein